MIGIVNLITQQLATFVVKFMKTNNLIRFIRGDKEIILYLNDENWTKMPNIDLLDFIVDVEVYPLIPTEEK